MVDKFTKAPTQKDVVDKVNEIIDNLGGSSIIVDSALSTTSENPVQNKVINSALNGKANDSDVVHKTGNETKSGTMTFNGKVTAAGDLLVGNSNTQHEGGQIDFAKCSNSSLKSNVFIDQYDDGLRFFCSNSSNQVSMPLQLEFNVGYAIGKTPATSDNSTKLATTAYVKNQGYLTSHQDISGKENTSNKVTSLSSSSTDTQYPSAKCVYDALQNSAGLQYAMVVTDYSEDA